MQKLRHGKAVTFAFCILNFAFDYAVSDYIETVRTLLSILIGVVTLWYTVQVFGWIVSGDIEIGKAPIKRDVTPWRFWLLITLLGSICFAAFAAALVIFMGIEHLRVFI